MAKPGLKKYYRWCSRDEIKFDPSPKKKIFCLCHALTLSGRSFIKNPVQFFSVIPRGVPLPHSNTLQYYVKREKCKVNDVIFPSGCEVRAINLGNKNVKIGILTGGTSIRSKNIFTDIYRYPTGKHEINIQDILWQDIISLYMDVEKPFLSIKKLQCRRVTQKTDHLPLFRQFL